MKKLNNKGFTVVELTVSFLFVFAMAFAMYELLYNYRVKQNEESIKAQLIDYKNQVTLAIQNDIYDKKLKKIDDCSYGTSTKDRCIVLNFNDNTSKQLAIEEGTRTISGQDYPITYIVYGDLIYESPDAPLLDFKINYMLYNTDESDNFEEKNVNVYKISIPIYHNDLTGNYGISIVAVGYNYTYNEVGEEEQGGSTTAPEDLNKAEGRLYNGYITGTNYTVRNNQLFQTLVAKVKFNSKGHQHILGNMQLGGSSLTVGTPTNKTSGQLCYNAYVKTNAKYSQTYKSICTEDLQIDTDAFYTIVGKFDSSNGKMDIFVKSDKKNSIDKKTLPEGEFSISSTILPSTIEYGVGGNSGGTQGVNTHYLDGVVSQVLIYDRDLDDYNISLIIQCFGSSDEEKCLSEATKPVVPVVNEKYSKN